MQGNDTVKATVSYELANDVRVETLRTINDAATTAIDLTGNSYANTLVGNAGANTLDGKGGADTMQGLGGDDTYYVNNAGDNVHEAAGQGADTVRSSVNYQLTAGQEIEALTTTSNNGVTAINLTGNDKAQTIVGNAGFNVLQGNGGDDYLQGRAGHDTLTGGAGEDKFLFNTTLNAATNVDTITDMTAGVDLIRLDDAFFAGIGPVGVLSADAFHIGATAADAEDRIVYNSATGQLFFDFERKRGRRLDPVRQPRDRAGAHQHGLPHRVIRACAREHGLHEIGAEPPRGSASFFLPRSPVSLSVRR